MATARTTRAVALRRRRALHRRGYSPARTPVAAPLRPAGFACGSGQRTVHSVSVAGARAGYLHGRGSVHRRSAWSCLPPSPPPAWSAISLLRAPTAAKPLPGCVVPDQDRDALALCLPHVRLKFCSLYCVLLTLYTIFIPKTVTFAGLVLRLRIKWQSSPADRGIACVVPPPPGV